MVKLSFIVPVYNVEQYLRKCVDSLLAQDYEGYEIILIDDGSTDGSSSICDDYVRRVESGKWKVESIRVIHQKNGGLSAARNAGVKAAKGEYVCFVDSDDYWEKNVLGGLMEQVERDKLDVLRFKYQNVRVIDAKHLDTVRLDSSNLVYEVFNPNKGNPYRNDDYSDVPTDGVSFLNSRFGTACYAVMFIVRRDLLVESGKWKVESECLFTEGIYYEDVDWTPRMLGRANRVASTDTIVYNYLVREGSITKAVVQSKKKKAMDDKIRLIATLQQQAVALMKRGRYNRWYEVMISAIVVGLIRNISGDYYENRTEYIEQLRQMRVLPIRPISWKARLINISPELTVELLHFKNGAFFNR